MKIKTQKQIDRFKELWIKGISQEDIGKEFGISQRTVSLTGKRLGLKKRKPFGIFHVHPRASDEELISFIREKGLCSYLEIRKKFNYSHSPTKQLRKLVRLELISTFHLKFGTSTHKRGALDLFNGFSDQSKGQRYYYVNEKEASKILIEKLRLTHSLSLYKRKRLTHYLKRALKPSLFRLVHNAYS